MFETALKTTIEALGHNHVWQGLRAWARMRQAREVPDLDGPPYRDGPARGHRGTVTSPGQQAPAAGPGRHGRARLKGHGSW